MVRIVLLVSCLGLAALIGAAVAAYAAFGLPGALLVGACALVGVPLALKLLGGKLLERLFKLPVKAKGAPLRGARTRLPAVRRATPPALAEDAGAEDAAPREWYIVELTITTVPPEGPFKFWVPAELLLVAPETDPEGVDEDDEWGHVHKARWWDEQAGGWQDADDASLSGDHRVRLLVGLRPGAPRLLRLRYYLEIFGRLDFARARQAA